MYSYFRELKLIEHLKVYLLDEISCQIDGSYPSHGSKGSSPNVVYLIVAQIQSYQETHAAKSVGVELPYFIVAQIQYLEQGVPRECPSIITRQLSEWNILTDNNLISFALQAFFARLNQQPT